MEYIRPKTHLLMQYYMPKNKIRLEEVNHCLITNLNNPCIDFVHNIMEPDVTTPPNITNHPKLVTTIINMA